MARFCRIAGCVERRKDRPDQNSAEGNDNKQLSERETAYAGLGGNAILGWYAAGEYR